MCGIAGIYAYRSTARSVDRDELVRIRDHMASRGPDGNGDWYSADGRVGFGHRRLSIIDLSSRGAQPMQTADGRLVITFNGEIYNYRALRSKLEAKGYAFRSNSDTEVLLHLYAELGHEMLRELRGMFAFGIWDSQESSCCWRVIHMGSSRCTMRTMGRPCGLLRKSRRSWRAAAFRKTLIRPDGLGFICLGACQSPSLHTARCAAFRPDRLYASTSADCARRSSITRLREPTAKRKNDRSRQLQRRKRLKLWSGKPFWTACVTISSLMSRSALSCRQEWIPAPSLV